MWGQVRSFLYALIAVAGTVSWAHAEDVVSIPLDDLAAKTRDWEGMTIETTAYCFYVELADFRCSNSGRVSVNFVEIEPKNARKSVESNCDAASKACRLRIRFVYDHYNPLSKSGELNVVAKDFKATVLGE